MNAINVALLILSIYIGIQNAVKLKWSINVIAPYFILGIILALAGSAAATLNNITLKDNLNVLSTNLFQVARNSFMGAIGIIVLDIEGTFKPMKHWEKSYRFWTETPKMWTIGLILLISIYTFALFSLIPNELKHIKEREIGIILQMSIFSILAAISEEMFIRLFVIGIIVYYLRRIKYNWILAIAVSSIFWAFLHVTSVFNDPIKFVHILGIGFALGFLLKKYGFESCVFVHIGFNLLNIFIRVSI